LLPQRLDIQIKQFEFSGKRLPGDGFVGSNIGFFLIILRPDILLG
jgi:hypothetical protein